MASGDGVIILGPGEGKGGTVMGLPMTFKATNSQTGGAFALLEVALDGDGPPLHTHRNEGEVSYILEGEGEAVMGDRKVPLSAGSFLYVPKGIPHTLNCTGSSPLKIMHIFVPGKISEFFEEVDGVADINEIMGLAGKFGMEFPG